MEVFSFAEVSSAVSVGEVSAFTLFETAVSAEGAVTLQVLLAEDEEMLPLSEADVPEVFFSSDAAVGPVELSVKAAVSADGTTVSGAETFRSLSPGTAVTVPITGGEAAVSAATPSIVKGEFFGVPVGVYVARYCS